MMFIVLVLALIAISTVSSAKIQAPVIPKEYLKSMGKSTSPFTNSVNATSSTTTAPYDYLVYTFYDNVKTCDPAAVGISGGLRFNSCLKSDDSSAMYSAGKQDANMVYFNMLQFSTSDCTGSYETYAASVPKRCMPSDGNSMLYQLVEQTTTPWSVLKMPGAVVLNFYGKDDCTSSASAGDMLIFQPLNVCMTVDSSDDAKSQFLPSCANGKRTVNQYSDTECKDLISSYPYPLSNCAFSEGAQVYETDLCV